MENNYNVTPNNCDLTTKGPFDNASEDIATIDPDIKITRLADGLMSCLSDNDLFYMIDSGMFNDIFHGYINSCLPDALDQSDFKEDEVSREAFINDVHDFTDCLLDFCDSRHVCNPKAEELDEDEEDRRADIIAITTLFNDRELSAFMFYDRFINIINCIFKKALSIVYS